MRHNGRKYLWRVLMGGILSSLILAQNAFTQGGGVDTSHRKDSAAWLGISSLPLIRDSQTRSISAENPTGEKGGNAKAIPGENNPASQLGMGWKVHPFIDLPSHKTVTLAAITGPGVIQHIWMTASPKAYRDCVLRFYWDDETGASVEVPLGDFFAEGHGVRYDVNSLMVAVNPSGGFNSYWPMPFRKRAVITLENQAQENITGFFYQVTYALEEVPEQAGYFHAQWRRSMSTREHPEHRIVDDIEGRGQYVGTFLAWKQLSNGWWGEGEVKFYIDGDKQNPTINGTGTEDYFGGAWGFGSNFSNPFSGYPYSRTKAGEIPEHSLYRWHVVDPIRFNHDLRVTSPGLVAEWKISTAHRRYCFGCDLVSARATPQFPATSGPGIEVSSLKDPSRVQATCRRASM